MSRVTWAPLLLLVFAVVLSSCGGGSLGTLRSIQINQQSAVDFPEYTATGTYSNGMQANGIAVSWVQWNFTTFVVSTPHYLLTASPFLPQCAQAGSAFTLAAIAPADPQAPSNGDVPLNVWMDIVTGKAQSEGGFVGARVQITCP